MDITERSHRRLVALVSAAIVLLLARVAVDELGLDPVLERGLYALAIVCLVGCVLVVLSEYRRGNTGL